MEKKLLIVLSVLIAVFMSFGNNSLAQLTITGTIVDASSQSPLEFATVSLFNDGKLVDGIITNQKGVFTLNAEKGNYLLKAEYISYQPYEVDVVLTANKSLGVIIMEIDAAVLDEVAVVAEKSTYELKLDKKVFNVGKDILANNGSLSQVLSNVPSVAVDVEGAVSLRGNSNVTILINGKPSVLTANNGLDQIAAQNIEKIEVITNPSSRYQATGTAGIINVILKKNTQEGFSGSVSLTAGVPADHRISTNLNYKTKKINLFSTLGYRYSNFKGEQKVDQTSYVGDQMVVLDQIMTQNRNDKAPNLYFGVDYFFNEKNTITSSYYKSILENTDETDYQYNYLNGSGSLDSTLVRNEDYYEPQNWNQLEMVYTKTFNKEAQKFTLNFQYDFWNDDENETLYTQKSQPAEGAGKDLRTRDIESSNDYLLQLDMVVPVGEKGTFETGIRGETRIITSDYLAENKVNGVWTKFGGLGNAIDYNEKIGGAYLMFSNEFKKIGVQLGLRAEHTLIEIADVENTFNGNKNYTQLFPTVHLNYNFNETTKVQFSFSKRINRPGFWQLNPFGGLSDLNAIRMGNPDLDPSFTNAFELGFLKQWEVLTFNPSVYYQQSTDFFSFYVKQNPEGVFVTKSINLDTEERLGVEVSSSYSPFKWMRWTGEFNFFAFEQKGVYEDQNFDFSNHTWSTRLNGNIKFPKDFALQTSFNYRAKNEDAQTLMKAQIYADLGLSKNLLNNKATVTLNARNILDSRKREWVTTRANFVSSNSRKYIGRRFSLTFLYRFNQKGNSKSRGPGGSIRG